VHRKVRKDGRVRFGGRLLEVVAELTGQHVELRFAPREPEVLPRVFVNNVFVCETVPLDRLGNAHRVRRRDVGAPPAALVPSGLNPLALMQAEHQLYTRPLSLKAELVRLSDEQHTIPIIVLDEAQQLSDAFLGDLSGFLNFAFDTRSAAALWLVGLPSLALRLRMQLHAPLATRIAVQVHLTPLEREDFKAFIEHGLKAAGTREKLLTDTASEMLFRVCRGIPRIASRVLRAGLKEAHARTEPDRRGGAQAAVESLTTVEEVRP
jgi:hypothetical protein